MRAALLLISLLSISCAPEEELSERACPPAGTTLTYQNFGRGFMYSWCVSCHGGPNGYSSRSFTDHASVKANRERIYVNSAAGNTTMPPGPDDPPAEEREKLAEWLACGAP